MENSEKELKKKALKKAMAAAMGRKDDQKETAMDRLFSGFSDEDREAIIIEAPTEIKLPKLPRPSLKERLFAGEERITKESEEALRGNIRDRQLKKQGIQPPRRKDR